MYLNLESWICIANCQWLIWIQVITVSCTMGWYCSRAMFSICLTLLITMKYAIWYCKKQWTHCHASIVLQWTQGPQIHVMNSLVRWVTGVVNLSHVRYWIYWNKLITAINVLTNVCYFSLNENLFFQSFSCLCSFYSLRPSDAYMR